MPPPPLPSRGVGASFPRGPHDTHAPPNPASTPACRKRFPRPAGFPLRTRNSQLHAPPNARNLLSPHPRARKNRRSTPRRHRQIPQPQPPSQLPLPGAPNATPPTPCRHCLHTASTPSQHPPNTLPTPASHRPHTPLPTKPKLPKLQTQNSHDTRRNGLRGPSAGTIGSPALPHARSCAASPRMRHERACAAWRAAVYQTRT
jgi:hypothetical protein